MTFTGRACARRVDKTTIRLKQEEKTRIPTPNRANTIPVQKLTEEDKANNAAQKGGAKKPAKKPAKKLTLAEQVAALRSQVKVYEGNLAILLGRLQSAEDTIKKLMWQIQSPAATTTSQCESELEKQAKTADFGELDEADFIDFAAEGEIDFEEELGEPLVKRQRTAETRTEEDVIVVDD